MTKSPLTYAWMAIAAALAVLVIFYALNGVESRIAVLIVAAALLFIAVYAAVKEVRDRQRAPASGRAPHPAKTAIGICTAAAVLGVAASQIFRVW